MDMTCSSPAREDECLPFLDTKPYRKRTLGTSGHRLEGNITERLTGKQCGVIKLFRLT
jgi:hypothetical protein